MTIICICVLLVSFEECYHDCCGIYTHIKPCVRVGTYASKSLNTRLICTRICIYIYMYVLFYVCVRAHS